MHGFIPPLTHTPVLRTQKNFYSHRSHTFLLTVFRRQLGPMLTKTEQMNHVSL